MRGASALNELLQEFPAEKLKVYVIWESVGVTDQFPPINAVLARVDDTRAAQYWDKDRLVAGALRARVVRGSTPIVGAASLVRGEVLWDAIFLYAAGARWGEDAQPLFIGAPVYRTTPALRQSLKQAFAHEGVREIPDRSR